MPIDLAKQLKQLTDIDLRAEYAAAMRPDRLWDVVSGRIRLACIKEADRRRIKL